MKKIFVAILALSMICTFPISAFAATEEAYIYTIEKITVIFDKNDTWDATTREAIAHSLVYGKNHTVATYNFWCDITGHIYETKGVTTITHCVLDEAPRCLEETFNISLCIRCNNELIERTSYGYIFCCP